MSFKRRCLQQLLGQLASIHRAISPVTYFTDIAQTILLVAAEAWPYTQLTMCAGKNPMPVK